MDSLMLMGSRPPSSAECRPGSSAYQHNYKQAKVGSTDDSDLSGTGFKDNYSDSTSTTSRSMKKTANIGKKTVVTTGYEKENRPHTMDSSVGARPPYTGFSESTIDRQQKHHNRHKTSYVDESLFGNNHFSAADLSFSPPWESRAQTCPHSRASPCKICSNKLKQTKAYKIQKKHKDTYVDEMLFGTKIEEPDFPPPWECQKASIPEFYKTKKSNVKTGSQTERAPSKKQTVRPASAPVSARTPSEMKNRKNKQFKPHFKQSHVDETLFGSTNNKGVQSQKKLVWDSGHEFGSTKGRNSALDFTVSGQFYSDKPPGPSGADTGYVQTGPEFAHLAKNKHKTKTGFVDETLFGTIKLVEADFPAPWENHTPTAQKPLLFDSRDYRVNVMHPAPFRPPSAVTKGRVKTKSINAKPAWR